MSGAGQTSISSFFKRESSGGIILMLSALFALIIANTPFRAYYDLFLDTPLEIRIGTFEIAKPLLLWVNDGLMAIFFFVIGLELKRELIEGELSDRRNIILPGIGAVGGMLVPALIYIYFNSGEFDNPEGWAVPAATDIAFALGVLSLLGSRVPSSVKIFLTSLAIFDDVGAILIIALFYTAKISAFSLAVVACCIVALIILNRRNVTSKSVYMMVGLIMWAATLKSGVHATLAGVVLAMFVPMRSKTDPDHSPLKELEYDLHSVVAYFVLPVFAFTNAGINFSGVGAKQLLHSVPMGIALGLFIGKQVGVFGFCGLAIKMKLTALPAGMTWKILYGASALCGIGFTMSLFIGGLAFDEEAVGRIFDERLGIVLGSLASGVVGYFVLRRALFIKGNESSV